MLHFEGQGSSRYRKSLCVNVKGFSHKNLYFGDSTSNKCSFLYLSRVISLQVYHTEDETVQDKY